MYSAYRSLDKILKPYNNPLRFYITRQINWKVANFLREFIDFYIVT